MISKEELEESKKRLQKRYDTAKDYTINQVFLTDDIHAIGIFLRYIEQLESEKEKIIEILEKRLKELDELKEKYLRLKEYEQVDIVLYKKREVEKMIKIMKGENDES